MKTVAISDLHGKDPRSAYDSLIFTYETKNKQGELSRLNNIIFLGDYVDNNTISQDLQSKRLLDLFWLQEHDERIQILVGNHELSYLMDDNDSEIKTILIEQLTKGNLKFAFYDGFNIYIHKVITDKFLKNNKIVGEPNQIVIQLNQMLQCKMFKDLNESINNGDIYSGCPQVVSSFNSTGMMITKNIYSIENSYHGNYILFDN